MGVSQEASSLSSEKYIKRCDHDHHSTTDHADGDHDGISCNLEKIKIKVQSLGDDGGDYKMKNVDEDDDGFKTPTAVENKIIIDVSNAPPAPMKPRKKLRKPGHRSNINKSMMKNFLQVSCEEIELLFPPRSVLVKDLKIVNKVVEKTNLSTLMSLR